MFPGRQKSIAQSSCSTAPGVANVTRHSRRKHLEEKQIASDRCRSLPGSASLNASERTTLLRQEAFREAQAGNYEAAIALFSLLISHNPGSAGDYNNRGLLYAHLGELDCALADYNSALQRNPRLAKIYNNRANCYASLERLVEALFDYETALDLNPADLHARTNQGITFRELEMYEQAIENFDLALQFIHLLGSPALDSTEAFTVGHIYAQRGRASHLLGDWNYAVADYHRALTALSDTDTVPEASQRLQIQVKAWLNSLVGTLPTL